MAFTSGTATDYHDLLDKLRLWLTGTAGWTQLRWVPPGSLTAVAELNLRGPGAGADKQVFINIRSQNDPTNSAYAWQISGATDYVAGQTWGQQPMESPRPYMNLWTSSINYWFYANSRRIIVVAKTSTSYTSMYAGFFLPWCMPPQYPFPLYIAGDFARLVQWSTTNAARRFFCDPGGQYDTAQASGWVRNPEGSWTALLNHVFASSNDANPRLRNDHSGFVWPWSSISNNSYTEDMNLVSLGGAESQSFGGLLDRCLPTAQGERILLPAHIARQREAALGTLDGVYCPLGSGLTVEQSVVIGGQTYRCFQNLNRNSGNDFVLIEEV